MVQRRLLIATLALTLLFGPAEAGAAPGPRAPAPTESAGSPANKAAKARASRGQAAKVTAEALEREISSRVLRVEEFTRLRQICQELRLRCWLFGGTAAGYGHYVKWDLQREAGDSRFQKDRFDYDYTNIFRSTQDADIVVDGTVEDAEKIERLLREQFPHFQGNKSAWEVRLLRGARGDKDAILDNPDFMNQHTDSNSTGMIEITEPPRGESPVRDVRDWKPRAGERPQFFRDLHENKLHYYFSDAHATTSRFKAGKNPEIFSVVRALTKAFQYELELRPADWAQLKRIVDRFDPAKGVGGEYALHWLEKNGSKIFQHAVNLEYAWNKSEELGIRRKLIALSDPKVEGSLGWWMSREPLRRKPVGKGTGETAAEIFRKQGWVNEKGELVVAHETRSFLAYESITRAHTGDPNVLISREAAVGENAAHGDGFYARAGRQGAVGTGLTIRFTVDPAARLHEDFELHDDFFIIRNKSAIKVIPESLNLDPAEYFEMLAKGESFDVSDKAILEKLKRRMNARLALAGKADLDKITNIVRNAGDTAQEALFSEYFSLPRIADHPGAYDVLKTLVSHPQGKFYLAQFALKDPVWARKPGIEKDVLLPLLNGGLGGGLSVGLLSNPLWIDHPDLLKFLQPTMDRRYVDARFTELLSHPRWLRSPERQVIESYIQKNYVDDAPWGSVIDRILTKPHWVNQPIAHRWVDQLLKKGDYAVQQVAKLLRRPEWVNAKGYEILERIFELAQPGSGRSVGTREAAEKTLLDLLELPHWSDSAKGDRLVFAIAEHPSLLTSFENRRHFMEHVFASPRWQKHPKLQEVFTKVVDERMVSEACRLLPDSPIWELPWMESWIDGMLTKHPKSLRPLFESVLSRPGWMERPKVKQWVRDIVTAATLNPQGKAISLNDAFSFVAAWREHPMLPELIELGVELAEAPGEPDVFWLASQLRSERLRRHPRYDEWVHRLMRTGRLHPSSILELLADPRFVRDPVAIEWIRQLELTALGEYSRSAAFGLFASPEWFAMPEVQEKFQRMLETGWLRGDNIHTVARSAHIAEHPLGGRFLEQLLTSHVHSFSVPAVALREPVWARNPASLTTIEQLFKRHSDWPSEAFRREMTQTLEAPHWRDHPALSRFKEDGKLSFHRILDHVHRQGKPLVPPESESCLLKGVSRLAK